MILADSLPGFKTLLRKANLSEAAYGHVLAFVATFLLHVGGMSAAQAAHLSMSIESAWTPRPHWNRGVHVAAALDNDILPFKVA
jgi:hypothetical protein